MTQACLDISIGELVRRAAVDHPERTVVSFVDGASYTAADLWRSVLSVAAGLHDQGVREGDRVGLMLENRVEFLETWLAAHVLGLIAVPINVALRGPSLAHILRLTEPSLIVCELELLQRLDAASMSAEIRPARFVVGVAGPEVSGTFASLRAAPLPSLPEVSTCDPCCIMYTSGTTGPSKGVIWTQRMTLHIAGVVRESMKYGADDILYTCLPLFHGNALTTSFVPALLAGAPIVVGRRFSASTFWMDVVRSRATATNLLGVMAPILLSREPSPDERAHRLRTALVIPAPARHYPLMKERFGLSITEAYGQVDLGMVLWNALDDPKPGSCGRPTRGYECRLGDARDDEVNIGDVGELLVRWATPNTASHGYWKNPEATAAAFRNLWFHTGDLMRCDQEGWFYFVDRTKDTIRRRGENISSIEVEAAALAHPDVLEAAAYAIPSALSEDEVALAIVVRSGASFDPHALLSFMEPNLPYFALPRFVRLLSELPRTQTEKIQKGLLRADGVTGDIWDRESVGYVVPR